MSEHIPRDVLIDYQFELVDDERAVIEEHLANCEQCRQALEEVKAQFGQLDLLKDDPELSPQLLASVSKMSEAPGPATGSNNAIKWILAAAAMVLIGLFIYLNRGKPVDKPDQPPIAKQEEEEQALFAPGSNIELNVLPRRDEVQLTIYNSANLTVVRERRKLTMKKGYNWLQYMWANTKIDPTSLEIKPLGVGDKVEVIQMVYPPRMKGVGRWLLHSRISGQVECEISYLTCWLGWRAIYEAVLSEDESTMDLRSHVRVDNRSGEDYANAEIRMVVGVVNVADTVVGLARTRPYQDVVYDMSFAFNVIGGRPGGPRDRRPSVIKKALSEYQLYTIEGKQTIPNRWSRRLPSMQRKGIPVSSVYKYDEERWGKSVMRFVTFKNDKASQLGETPLPRGKIQLFSQPNAQPELDSSKRFHTFVGETAIKYVPTGAKAELELGRSERVLVEPKLMSTQTKGFEFDRNGNVSGWKSLQVWQVELANTRDIAVDIELTRRFSRIWHIEPTGDVVYKKIDMDAARFEAKLRPHERRVFTYRLTEFHGSKKQK